MQKIVAWLAIALMCGCATPPDDAQPITPILPVNVGLERDRKRVAVCIGWTAVDPTSPDFAGWNGDCPGCNLDAWKMYDIAKAYGFNDVSILLNAEATWTKMESHVLSKVKDLTTNDLVLLAMSGHGTQVKDLNGDESDGMDEAICTWDKIVVDDVLLQTLYKFPSGLRVVLINDQCHSEGNFRGLKRAGRFITRTVTLGKYGKVKGKILIKNITRKDGWTMQLIQFAGCHEHDYSYGDSLGGRWTMTLADTLKETLSWKQWFEAAKAKMSSEQEPVFSTMNANESFINGVVLK